MTDKENIISEILKSPKGLLQKKSFSIRYPEAYGEISQWISPDGFTFPQMLYHYLHNDKELMLGLCPVCGKRCGFKNFINGYSAHCSARCSTLDKETQAKRIETCIATYGETHPNKSEAVKEKARVTSIERYGTDNPAKSDKIKEKAKQTNIERHGAEYYSQTDECKRKVRKSWDNKTPDELTKMERSRKATRLNRYGDENYNNREKFQQTCEEKYGVENVFQLQEVKEKSITTSLEHYGVKHYTQTDEYKEKTRELRAKMTPEEISEIARKIEATIRSRYGVSNYSQTDAFKDAIRNTWNNKPRCVIDKINNIRKATCEERYGVENYSSTDEWRSKVKQTNLKKYGVEWACMRPESRNYKTISKVNLAFAEQLSSNGIEYEMEFPLGSYSYDFKVGDALIEIDPTITHNSFLNIFGSEPKHPDYHLNKTRHAAENGYRCIHIWDWDDAGKIISMLKPKQTLYARKLTIREVDDTECNEFLNAYHLQNTCKGQSIRLGLYADDMLVELMTFGKPRYNRNYEYELLRLCSHSDYMVVGGAERLFRHFAEHYNPQSIISYCDASKFDGGVYDKLGFDLMSISRPTIHWWDSEHHITDNLLRQRGFDQLFGTEYGKGTDNEALMLEHGFLPVYDCGQMSFGWKAEI